MQVVGNHDDILVCKENKWLCIIFQECVLVEEFPGSGPLTGLAAWKSGWYVTNLLSWFVC
jgi:hypothetical protein